MVKDSDEYSSKETKQRFDAMLKGALKSPPKPLTDKPRVKKRVEPKTKPK
jgi:hypothetical protein